MFYNGVLGIHSLLRWALIILLVINISRSFFHNNKPYSTTDRSWNLRLIIATHINLVIGLYAYFFGPKGYMLIKTFGFGEVMKSAQMRFWAVEHFTGMIIAIVLITITSSISKAALKSDTAKHKKLFWLYFLALITIIATVPWPFRFSEIPWFRGLY